MDTILAVLIVALAGAYVFRSYYRVWKSRAASSCGCSSCDLEARCSLPTREQTGQENSLMEFSDEREE